MSSAEDGWQLAKLGGRIFAEPGDELEANREVCTALTSYKNEFNGEKWIMTWVHEIRERVYTREKLVKAYRKWKRGGEICDGNVGAIFAELGLSRAGVLLAARV